MSKISTVRAKFRCVDVQDAPEYSQKSVQFHVVTDGCEENKSFSKYTPSGIINMIISYDTPAVDAFESGKEYYVDFTPVEQ